jgi:hypothetical protein
MTLLARGGDPPEPPAYRGAPRPPVPPGPPRAPRGRSQNWSLEQERFDGS